MIDKRQVQDQMRLLIVGFCGLDFEAAVFFTAEALATVFFGGVFLTPADVFVLLVLGDFLSLLIIRLC